MRKKRAAERVGERVREAAPAYAAGAPSTTEVHSAADVHTVLVGERGRVVLPADVRERMNIQEGDRLTLRVERDGTITIQTPAVLARSLLGIFKDIAPGRSLVDELIADRRREAMREQREYREAAALSPRAGVRRRKRPER